MADVDWDKIADEIRSVTATTIKAMEEFARVWHETYERGWHETYEGHRWVDERPIGYVSVYRRCAVCGKWQDDSVERNFRG